MKSFFSSKVNIILILLLLISIATVSFLILDVNTPDVVVSDFTNSTFDEVNNWAKENNIIDKVVFTYEFDENVPENFVIYQSLKEGDKVEDTIEFIISKGKDPNALIPLPEIVDTSTKDEIEKWFNDNNFTNVKYQYVLSDTPLETVLAIDKTSAARTDQILVTVSCGDNEDLVTIIVSDFSTFTKDDVSLWASGYGINIKYSYQDSTTLENDTYISQNPNPGEIIKTGSTINIVLAKKVNSETTSDEITVPDTYLWYKEADFVAAIEKLGLKAVKSTTTHKNSAHNTGEVYSYQSSSDGIKFKSGDSVTYYLVDNGDTSSDTVTVPDTLLGKKESEFIEAIEKLGLKVEKQTKTYKSGKYSTGSIYSYDSTSDGIKFKAGDTVKYWLVDNGDSSSNEAVTVPDSYIGNDEKTFISNIESLGLKAVKQTTTYKSKKYSTGQVYSYSSTSDGITFHKGDEVKYWLVDNGDGGSSSTQTTTTTSVTVPDSYLGLSETDFIAAIEKLGLKASKQTKTYKSAKYKTGTVYAYDSSSDGIKFKTGDTVKYYLVDNGDSSSSSSQTTENTSVTVPDSYLWYQEKDFIAAIEKLGLKASKAGSKASANKTTGQVYSYQSTSDGINFKKGDTVKYYIVDNGSNSSSQSQTTPTVETFTLDNLAGKSKAEVTTYCSNKGITVNFAESYSSSVSSGCAISSNPSAGTSLKKGDSITVTISLGEQQSIGTILSSANIMSYYKGQSFDDTKSKLTSYFNEQGFSNVTINGVNGTKTPGVIVSVTVNGVKNSYTAGDYPTNTPIVVEVINNQVS